MIHNQKSALVTGGAKRIGRAFSLALADMGYDIALHYASSESAAKHTADEIRSEGRTCELFQCDLSRIEAVRELIPDVFARFPGCEVLINNASIFQKRTFQETTPDFFETMLNIHLKAPFFLSQSFAGHCRYGLIVNMTDTRITHPSGNYFTYTLSKQMLFQLTKMTAKVLGPDIRVNAIAPGMILPSTETTEAQRAKMQAALPLRREGNPRNLVSALEYLVRDDFVTGECLFVDGGEHLCG